MEATIKDPNFLGTVALAGASDLEEGLDSVLRAKLPVLNGLVAFSVYGVRTLYPELDLKDILTSKALAIYNASVEDGAASGAFAALTLDETSRGRTTNTSSNSSRGTNLETKWYTAPAAGRWRRQHFVYRLRQPQNLSAALQRRARVQRNVYSGLGRDPVVYGSLRDQLDWIAARFAGEPAPSNCPAS